jgi:hypothetical protein
VVKLLLNIPRVVKLLLNIPRVVKLLLNIPEVAAGWEGGKAELTILPLPMTVVVESEIDLIAIC